MQAYTVKRQDVRTKKVYTLDVIAKSKIDAIGKAAEILALDGISFTKLVNIIKK